MNSDPKVLAIIGSLVAVVVGYLTIGWWDRATGRWAPRLLRVSRMLEARGWRTEIDGQTILGRKGEIRLQIWARCSRFSSLDFFRIELASPTELLPDGARIFSEAKRGAWAKLSRPDLKIGCRKLDAELYFTADEPEEVRQVFKNDEGRGVIRKLLEVCGSFELEKGTLSCACGSPMAPGSVQDVLSLLEQIRDSLSGGRQQCWIPKEEMHPWRLLAKRESLRFQPSRSGQPMQLSGERSGQTVEVRVIEDEDIHTQLEVRLKEAMPAGLGVRPSSEGLVSSVELHNPILNGRLAVFGRPPDQVRALLNHDQVMPALMAVYEGLGGARVDERCVRIQVPGELLETDTLVRLLDEMVVLAQALDEAARAR